MPEQATRPNKNSNFQGLMEEATPTTPSQIAPMEEAGQSAKNIYSQDQFAVSELDTLKLLSEQTGMPYVELANYHIDLELLKEVPFHVAQAYKIFPLKREVDGSILMAISDPMNVKILDDLRLLLDKPVSGAIASEADIDDAINMYYGIGETNLDSVVESMHEDNADQDIVKDSTQIDLTNLEQIASEAPVIKYVNLLMLQAIKDGASDLHVEPFGEILRIRYRVDGVLHEFPSPPKHLHIGIQSRLKVMAAMDIAERRLPQDGRIKLNLAGRQIDLRVSSLPTIWGESIVLRILDKSMMMMGLEQIGLLPEIHEDVRKCLDKPNGILLVTGPTGCGKTTTLYASLNEIFTPELKVITTEDPVEYELEGVVQVNIREAVGLTFAACLRSILRQDPDVIMVGEIRDLETAQISIQAALTGHLVLSTLHTNDAPGTVTRLIDMEIEPFLISSTLEGVVAQRLVRTICPNCREEYTPQPELLKEMKVKPEDVKEITFYHGKGCEDCNFTGYKGRIGIFELLTISESIRDLILERASTNIIARQARKDGMMTMRDDGWQKVLAGITTIEEVLRVTYGVEELKDKDKGKDSTGETADLPKDGGPQGTSEDAAKIVAGQEKPSTGEEAQLIQ